MASSPRKAEVSGLCRSTSPALLLPGGGFVVFALCAAQRQGQRCQFTTRTFSSFVSVRDLRKVAVAAANWPARSCTMPSVCRFQPARGSEAESLIARGCPPFLGASPSSGARRDPEAGDGVGPRSFSLRRVAPEDLLTDAAVAVPVAGQQQNSGVDGQLFQVRRLVGEVAGEVGGGVRESACPSMNEAATATTTTSLLASAGRGSWRPG